VNVEKIDDRHRSMVRVAVARPLHCAADGSPEEKDVEGPPRPASRAACDRGTARQHLPAVRLAEAAAPHLPDLRHLQGPRGRAAPPRPPVDFAAVARIAVDALGGDNAPREVILGALDAVADGIEVTLYGPASLDTEGLPLVATTDRIDMGEKPVEAVRAKPDSSLVAAVRAAGAGEADAVVSAGNTGAMLAAGLLYLRRLPGVLRPAIAVPIPAREGVTVLLDAGANADARPEHLVQFAHMGAVFCEELLDVHRPLVRLLSIGEEDEKGNQLTLETNRLLREEGDRLNFGGNAESRDLLLGLADVIVADGFTGNVVLKLLEGTIKDLLDVMRAEITATVIGKLGGLLIQPSARRLRNRFDPDTYGGAYLLGLRGLAVIAHGNSQRRAIANAIRLAARGVDHRVVDRLAERLPARVRV
jgi:phosphate acyltransferase